MPAANPHPHPTIILTTRLIRHYEHADPINAPLKTDNDYEALRNIAYLHATHGLIIIDRLKEPLWIRHKTETTTNTQHNNTSQENHGKTTEDNTNVRANKPKKQPNTIIIRKSEF